ncbi:Co2+/Mg2+ efflux protein ApaG [Bdellovibrio sp. 22V]|uniref:Co2+/Mg2+ efflux protein ApaG n=1 Tax=Bdellovibrio TaxID=958 RepID=UPI002542C200|nr:Co2+/Mg2+ efflux protein ApaG [Bdellovibrio sp. 22V]WII73676.1 Co2+/Mg2+ efflux protein ApaG [Bdellovibrio sp. 22V]
MAMQKTAVPEFVISTKVVYVPSESKPEQGYHFFAYKISITNKGTAPAQLMSRHWVITDSRGHKEEVRGPGVVGMQPKIQPGQTFEYDSACPLNASAGSMQGRYYFVAESGESFSVEVPEFYLIAPHALH